MPFKPDIKKSNESQSCVAKNGESVTRRVPVLQAIRSMYVSAAKKKKSSDLQAQGHEKAALYESLHAEIRTMLIIGFA